MKSRKILFLDRDGTIIVEPKDNFQVDSLEKLEFIPGVISALRRIVTFTNFSLVMVTNQDGLGTPSLPEENFWPAHHKMLQILAGEGIHFDEILIDRTFEQQKASTRKPRTGLLTKYIEEGFDLSNSFVIGDRLTDLELGKNLKIQAIYFSDTSADSAILSTTNWDRIASFILSKQRSTIVKRKTNETDVYIDLSLDGSGKTEIDTGLGFFNHMLDQLGRHSSCDLKIKVTGDLHVDEHHTIEDTALALGEAFYKALGDKKGIDRYGFLLPMDEAQAQVALDFSGRNWLVWEVDFKREKIGDMPTEMFFHFFKSFTDTAKATLHISASGENEHHKIEVIFKAFAKSLKMAINRNEKDNSLPSTKGIL